MNTYTLDSHNSAARNSSGGKLLKWETDGKFIKTSTYIITIDKVYFNYESYAEVIASRIARRIGLNAIEYKLCKVIIDNKIETIGCESKDFRNISESYLSVAELIRFGIIRPTYINDQQAYRIILSELSSVPGFIDTLTQTIFLDSLILNTDRHFGNFGILSKPTGEVRTAPIFDNGNSMTCDKPSTDFKYNENLLNILRCKPFNINFNEQLKLIGDFGREIDLSTIPSYTDNIVNSMISNYNLPSGKGKIIRDLIRSRVGYYIQRRKSSV